MVIIMKYTGGIIMTDYELDLFERYIKRLENELQTFKENTKYIIGDQNIGRLRTQTIDGIQKKIDQLYKVKSDKKLRKIVHLDKILSREDRMRR